MNGAQSCYGWNMVWQPLIEPARVAPILRDIARELAQSTDEDDRTDYALLRSYLAADGAVPDDDDTTSEAIAGAVDRLARGSASPALYGGASRVGWTVAHLADGEDADAVCSALDAVLLRRLREWEGDYDLISGVTGVGVYALERGEAGAPLVSAIVDELERVDARTPRWLTPPTLLPPHQREVAPEGYVNLGLAHGIPGSIAVLARFVERGLEAERSRALLDRAIAYVLELAPPRAHGRFRAWLPEEAHPSARLAWCYNDLGVAAALLVAHAYAGHAEAGAAGREVARDCAARSIDDAMIFDAHVCHGAGGIGHLFNRMAQATGDAVLREAASRWIDHTIAMRTTEPIAGFPSSHPKDGKRIMQPDASMLTGAAGVGLVLHAASSEVEPSWDRLLMVELPPR